MFDLSAAGLSKPESICYKALVSKAAWKPVELANFVNITRTNCYKILDNLTTMGLATKFDKGKTLHYSATSPTRLIELVQQQRTERETAEKQLAIEAQDLMTKYIKVQEQPGVRFYQGKTGIAEIFDQYEISKSDIYFVHTTAGTDFYGEEAIESVRQKATTSQIRRHGLTPDTKMVEPNYAERDRNVLLDRTWMPANAYTAPVEWGTFEDTLYIISYGQEAIGMTIQSTQIAEAFRQIYKMLERGQRNTPDYHTLPRQIKN